MALPPVLLIPIEYVLYRRRVSGRAIAGTVISFVGVALLFGIVGG
jgi:drug/metabolite transporter (DMT)-like permease